MFTELYRDEKKEEGDRGGQKDKRAAVTRSGPGGSTEVEWDTWISTATWQ